MRIVFLFLLVSACVRTETPVAVYDCADMGDKVMAAFEKCRDATSDTNACMVFVRQTYCRPILIKEASDAGE